MSDIQKILKAIADGLDIYSAGQMRLKLYTVVHTLEGLADYYHNNAVKAAFIGEIKEEEEQ